MIPSIATVLWTLSIFQGCSADCPCNYREETLEYAPSQDVFYYYTGPDDRDDRPALIDAPGLNQMLNFQNDNDDAIVNIQLYDFNEVFILQRLEFRVSGDVNIEVEIRGASTISHPATTTNGQIHLVLEEDNNNPPIPPGGLQNVNRINIIFKNQNTPNLGFDLFDLYMVACVFDPDTNPCEDEPPPEHPGWDLPNNFVTLDNDVNDLNDIYVGKFTKWVSTTIRKSPPKRALVIRQNNTIIGSSMNSVKQQALSNLPSMSNPIADTARRVKNATLLVQFFMLRARNALLDIDISVQTASDLKKKDRKKGSTNVKAMLAGLGKVDESLMDNVVYIIENAPIVATIDNLFDMRCRRDRDCRQWRSRKCCQGQCRKERDCHYLTIKANLQNCIGTNVEKAYHRVGSATKILCDIIDIIPLPKKVKKILNKAKKLISSQIPKSPSEPFKGRPSFDDLAKLTTWLVENNEKLLKRVDKASPLLQSFKIELVKAGVSGVSATVQLMRALDDVKLAVLDVSHCYIDFYADWYTEDMSSPPLPM